MARINERDWKILDFLMRKKETRWKELEDSRMMAKSTLSKHLRELRGNKLIRKKFSETANCVVYVLTSKGKKIYEAMLGKGIYQIEDFM